MADFQSSCISKQEATVSKLASSLPPYGNTIIPHEIMEKHTRSWQAHLKPTSSNFKSEEKYLEECWEKCLRLGVTLPIKVLRIEDEHGNMNVVQHSSVNRLEMESDYNLEPEQHSAKFMDSIIAEHEMQASVATKTTEENILTFELVPDVSELPLDALDDNVCNDEKNQQESVVSVPIDSVPRQNTSVITNDNPPDQTTDMDRNGSCITKIGRFL
jgi:hypothetical protein